MRQFSIALCAAVIGCGFAVSANADSHPLTLTLDLLSPCSTGGPCTGDQTDIGLQIPADSFTYSQNSDLPGTPFVASLNVAAPVVCDEISSNGTPGAKSQQRFAPSFTNAATGGLLEFNAGGPSIVDLGSIMYDGTEPAGVAGSYSNLNAPQVTCYQINPVTGGPQVTASGPSGIFAGAFEDHFVGEPWVSVTTVNSPSGGTGQQSGIGNPHTSIAAQPNQLVYVVQVHNAGGNDGWRLNLGYDYAFFDPESSGATPVWCVLPPVSSPQPGALLACGTSGSANSTYTLNSNDVQSATNSVYLQVVMTGSNLAVNNWAALPSATYPATASIFPKFGTYPQRFDDKSAVVSSNNLPVLNVSSIVCNNDTFSTSCTIHDQDGNPITGGLQGLLSTASSISSGGVVSVNPLAYFVDPTSGNTLPGTSAIDAMSVSNVSCSDPSGILAPPGIAFAPNNGSLALDFSFASSGGLYVPGTATCTATFATPAGFFPPLSRTSSFTITMGVATATHFSVSAPASATAGVQFGNVVVTALDASDNTVGSYSGTVTFSSTDNGAMLPANAVLINGVGTFSATLTTSGSRKITATDSAISAITGTSASISVSAAAATHFSVNAPTTVTTVVPFNLSVTAYDQFNNLVTNYAGTVSFSVSNPDVLATLPVDSTLTFGTGVFSATLVATGSNQHIIATDTTAPSVTGTSDPIEVDL